MNSRRRAGLPALAALALLALALFCPSLVAPARAASGRAECRAVPSRILGHPVPYCILLPPDYDTQKTRRFPVLYFLHGLGGNAQMLIVSGAMNDIDDAWQSGRLGQFLIVTPSADTSFYINSYDGRDRYQDFFLREFMPFIERHYRTLPGRRNRGIGGISMGGYGALHLAFSHPGLFGSVTASSAALIPHLPRVRGVSTESLPVFRILGRVFGNPFNRAFWDRNDPLHLARTADLRGMKIEFDCGEQDGYGFEYGAIALDKILTERHVPHVFHLYPGGHNWQYFAQRLPAALEFQSRAFGLKTQRAAK
jgi:S-formylglutathione hydrolase FrmB